MDPEEVGHGALLQTAHILGAAQGGGVAGGEGVDGLGAGEALVREEPARWVALGVLAGLGRGQAHKGIGILHRGIAAESQEGAAVEEAPPGEGLGHPLGAQAIGGPGVVRGAVHGLDTGHHALLPEAGGVLGGDDLGVLDAGGQLAPALLGGLGQQVQG